MLTKLIHIAALTTLTAASFTPPVGVTCATGSALQCCNSVVSASDNAITNLLGLLGVTVTGANLALSVGVACAPIDVSAACGGTAACCAVNDLDGAVALGCVDV
ncbi:hypothetical protein C8Q78DRAFT_1081449 [Trametes maxima]|nr:hypothetical protein C8Q78DRAFT_1081449 [Trametes maxima]